jgi:hypothetical protein
VVRFLDKDFVIPNREVTVQERDAKSFVGALLHKAAPDFVEACVIVSGEMSRTRQVNVR